MSISVDRRLAILGAPPTFDTPRHVGAPNLPDPAAFTRRIDQAVKRRYLTNSGPFVEEFEERIATRLGVRHCITTSNATTGLMLLARALGLSGDVALPAFTFVATAHAMRWLGLRPLFCDVDPTSHTVDPARLEETLTDETSAILGVHVWGRACQVVALQEIANSRGIPLFFDAAPAFDCSHGATKIGNFGVAEVVSFHATKVLNTFEGGAILTNDDDLAQRLRRMSRFGFEDEDLVVALGINAKMSEAGAAMGLAQLEQLDHFIAVNREHLARYRALLAGLPGVSIFDYPPGFDANCHYVVLEVDRERAPLDRDTLKRVLVSENVLARRYFYPGCHRMAPYSREDRRASERLPETEALVERVLQLPTGTATTMADIDEICRIIQSAFEHAESLSAALRTSPR